MNLNTIQALGGQRFVLLPIEAFELLAPQIKTALLAASSTTAAAAKQSPSDYAPFKLDDYVRNPVALARIQANITQADLAKRMKVTQPYIAKLESQSRVSIKTLQAVTAALV